MALDLQGYSAPVNQFEGLYRLSDTLGEQQRNKEATQQREQARRASLGGFLTDYLDPKNFMTGTVYDPYISDRIGSIMQKGVELANMQGMDSNMLLGAISGEVNKLVTEANTIKTIDQQRKEAEKILGSTKGIDLQKFNNRFKEHVYFETDANGQKQLKDISQIRPDQDWADEVVRTQPIYNNTGFDEFVSKSGKQTKVEGAKIKDSKGALRQTNLEMTHPSFMQPEVDEKGVFTETFVPKYKIAVDQQKPIIAEFLTEEGRTVPAAIRVVDDEVWTALNPSAKAFAVQEARRFAQAKGIPASDPKVEMFAKALAYDELKSSGKQYSTFKENTIQQAAPAPRVTVNVGGGKNNTPNSATEGNEFDRFTFKTPKGYTVTDGMATDPSGKPFTGKLNIQKSYVPQGTASILKAAGVDLEKVRNLDLDFVDGKLESMTPNGGLKIDRTDMQNFQLKYNSEPQKGAQPEFGKRDNNPTPTPKPTGKVKIKVDGKVWEVDASALPQMQKDGVKFTKI